MHVALLFPPAADPRAPHLAIPSLTACLRRDGVRVSVRDLNLESLLWSLRADVLREAERKAHARLQMADGTAEERERLRAILDRAGMLIERAAPALAALRDPLRFFDPDEYNYARIIVRSALALFSAQAPRVRYEVTNAVYEVEGVDRTALRDLVRVTADAHANLFAPFWEESVLAPLDRDRPDFVGVSILNGQQIIPGLTLARRLKERGHTVLIGGTVYAKFVKELSARPEFFALFCDGLVPYEGESAFRALAAGARLDGPKNDVPNLMRLDANGQPVMGPTRVEDVNALPTPDFTLLPLRDYLAPFPVLPILTGKGCYFNRCKFCDIPRINHISTKPYRVRKVERIADDIGNLHRTTGARHFVVTDETLSPNLLCRLADAIEARPDVAAADPRFVGYARFEKGFTPDVCTRLYGMGVRKLFFGLESGSQAMLDHMDKGVDVNVARRVLGNCVNAGLAVHVFSIVGFPQETESNARETLSFFLDNAAALEHPRNSFDIHPFGLDLRTAYAENAESYGAIIDEAALAASDFPISVRKWRNRDGLSEEQVANLLAEFNATLRRRFEGTRLYPEQNWPGFEEYAVLYSDYYDGRPFAFRTALPPADDPQRFTLAWAPHVRHPADDEKAFRPWIPLGALSIEEVAAATLEPLPDDAMDVDTLLRTLCDRVAYAPERRSELVKELRRLINELIETRVMWFRPAAQDERNITRGATVRAAAAMPVASFR